ncbi:MAG: hypothetical protein IT349_08855 [Candidatus Eisenbacteria bacterium]|nr:hypothetical protein [Candidatus Eisenbacteria bacterium]MCC7142195.1 hypothetical protein [Candidatus Eisenbacteria bacterium]
MHPWNFRTTRTARAVGALIASCAFALSVSQLGAAPARAADLPYAESFDGPDGANWPSPWFPGGAHVTAWDLQANRGRLNGDPTFVSRMILSGYSELDVEMTATVEFDNVVGQGFGFYVRQNGGTLQEYQPHGQGYAMFLKGDWAWPDDLGLWREIDGVETQFAWGFNPIPGGLQNDVRYRLRYRVTQTTPTETLLQARVWIEGQPEPALWTIEALDTHPLLQGTTGSFAIDIYNHFGTSPLFVDDLVLERVLDPSEVPHAGGATRLELSAPYPHPIRGEAWIECDLPGGPGEAIGSRGSRENGGTDASLSWFDASGRLIARPEVGPVVAGRNRISLRATHANGTPIAPGVYYLRLDVPGDARTRRVVVVR